MTSLSRCPRVFAAIEEPLEHEDPSDRLPDGETQSGGCASWASMTSTARKSLEMALLIGVKPVDGE